MYFHAGSWFFGGNKMNCLHKFSTILLYNCNTSIVPAKKSAACMEVHVQLYHYICIIVLLSFLYWNLYYTTYCTRTCTTRRLNSALYLNLYYVHEHIVHVRLYSNTKFSMVLYGTIRRLNLVLYYSTGKNILYTYSNTKCSTVQYRTTSTNMLYT